MFKFSFHLIPLIIILHSKNYPLTYENDAFHLQANSIKLNEEIIFLFDILHFSKSNQRFSISKKSLQGNKILKSPYCNFDNNKLTIKFTEFGYTNGLYTVYITDDIKIPIQIKTNIIQFNCSIKVYNNLEKKFVNSDIQIFNFPNTKQNILLYLDMNMEVNPDTDIKVLLHLTEGITIESINIKSIDKLSCYILIQIQLTKIITLNQNNIIIDIKDKEKETLKINFKLLDNVYIIDESSIHNYAYNYKQKIFVQRHHFTQISINHILNMNQS